MRDGASAAGSPSRSCVPPPLPWASPRVGARRVATVLLFFNPPVPIRCRLHPSWGGSDTQDVKKLAVGVGGGKFLSPFVFLSATSGSVGWRHPHNNPPTPSGETAPTPGIATGPGTGSRSAPSLAKEQPVTLLYESRVNDSHPASARYFWFLTWCLTPQQLARWHTGPLWEHCSSKG